jgi:hypothetical protein
MKWGIDISVNVWAMNAMTLTTMSIVTTDLRPVVQRGMKGWMRGEPMREKLARGTQLSNPFRGKVREFLAPGIGGLREAPNVPAKAGREAIP